MDDYYKILNVNKNDSKEIIKKAYRKLQMKNHPDRPDGNLEISKKINKAYEILSDPEKRKIYDNKILQKCLIKMDNIDKFVNNKNIVELFNIKKNNFLKLNKPIPIVKSIEITYEQAYNGTKIPIEIERWYIENNIKNKEKENIYIDIFPGIDNNEMIILKNKGNIIEDNKGDIKIFVKIKKHKFLKRKGLDIIYNKNITLKECLLGFSFIFMHPSNKKYAIKVENNNDLDCFFTNNYKKIIKNMGYMRNGTKGDLIINLKIEYPKKLTKEQKEKIINIL